MEILEVSEKVSQLALGKGRISENLWKSLPVSTDLLADF